MTSERDNLRAGIFVIVGIVLAMVVVIIISDLDRMLQRKQTVNVYYPLLDGLQGLASNAVVSLGDVPVGWVTGFEDFVDPTGDGSAPRVVGKIVRVKIPARYSIYWDAHIELVVPVLGTGTKLNIRSVGTGMPYDPAAPMPPEVRESMLPVAMRDQSLPPGAILGTTASTLTRNLISSALSSVGFEDTQRRQVKSIVASLDVLTGDIKDLPDLLRQQVSNIGEKSSSLLDKTTATVDHMNATVSDVKQLVLSVRTRSEKWMDHADRIAVNSDEGIADLKDLIDRQTEQIDQTIDKIYGMIGRLNERTLPAIDHLLDTANVSMDNMHQMTATGKDLVVGQRPVLERTMANMHLVSEQLKLAAIEVRRSPWRLLNRPGKKELETDNLYDSVRSFAQAAASVEAALASLRSLADANPEAYEQLEPQLQYLEELHSRFQDAEQRFWQELEIFK